jgi:RNA polymerase sigma factor for flagellar operon FliA
MVRRAFNHFALWKQPDVALNRFTGHGQAIKIEPMKARQERELLRLNDADDGEDSTLDRLPHEGPDPQGEALEDARRQAVTTAIKALPERERLVLSLYYEQELNLKEIGAVLKVTESRACQLHGQALVRLKALLTEWRG